MLTDVHSLEGVHFIRSVPFSRSSFQCAQYTASTQSYFQHHLLIHPGNIRVYWGTLFVGCAFRKKCTFVTNFLMYALHSKHTPQFPATLLHRQYTRFTSMLSSVHSSPGVHPMRSVHSTGTCFSSKHTLQFSLNFRGIRTQLHLYVTPVLMSVHSSTECVFYIECILHMNFSQLHSWQQAHTPIRNLVSLHCSDTLM